jgi:hypothetical protein
MANRISLYFEPYAWERLNRYLSLLLLSGKPMYDLPTMNDLIEGMVVHVANLYSGLAVSSNDLSPYIEGILPSISPSNLKNIRYNKGRIAFNVSPRTKMAIQDMRKHGVFFSKSGSDENFLEKVSDPILIRACVYFELSQGYSSFDENLYFSFLFGFRPLALSFDKSQFKNEVLYLTEFEKNNLRMISWDDGIIRQLSKDLNNYSEGNNFSAREETAYLPPGEVENPKYQSRGFDFSYFSGFVGFVALRNSRTSDLPVPSLLTDFKVPYDYIKSYTDQLENILKLSFDFNTSRFLDEQKTEPSKRVSIDANKITFTTLDNSELNNEKK